MSSLRATIVPRQGCEFAVFPNVFSFFARTLAVRRGALLAPSSAVPIELVIGRWLAWCSHPVAAWRVLPASGRALILASYFVSSYLAVLLALITFFKA